MPLHLGLLHPEWAVLIGPPPDSWIGIPQQNIMSLGWVRRTEPITNSFVQFAKLKLTTVDRHSSLNGTNEFLIGAVRRTAPIAMHLLIENGVYSFLQIKRWQYKNERDINRIVTSFCSHVLNQRMKVTDVRATRRYFTCWSCPSRSSYLTRRTWLTSPADLTRRPSVTRGATYTRLSCAAATADHTRVSWKHALHPSIRFFCLLKTAKKLSITPTVSCTAR